MGNSTQTRIYPAVDSGYRIFENLNMSIDTCKPLTQEEADHRAMLEHAFKGSPLNPEVSRRVEEQAQKIQAEMKKKGETNFTLDLLHESRDE